MQKAAVQVMEEYGGRIPEDFETLLSLKGIGRYTAGAIASIAYGKKVPAVDGNVLRVYARLTENRGDIMKQSVRKSVENDLTEQMFEDRPGDKDVKEGGGLSGIRKRVEQCGGTLRICAESKFSIIVKIPKEVRR